MKAMIFAAGFGTRLQPLTNHLPKALVPVRNRPVLEWVIRYLQSHGITEIIINTHYLSDQIHTFVRKKQFPISISFSDEAEILGTGGGLFRTKNFWDDTDFLVQNVDILCTANLTEFVRFHKEHSWMATLATHGQPTASRLLVDEAGLLCGLEKNGERNLVRQPFGSLTAKSFSGIHVISPQLFAQAQPKIEFSIIDLYLRLARQGALIGTWDIQDAYWIDIGNRESLIKAEKEYPGEIRD